MNDVLKHASQELGSAKRIAILTGAGISAESGIPTFRDALTGLWVHYNPADLATPEAFARNPSLVSRWYDERRCHVAKCRPNAGHFALARLQHFAAAKGAVCKLITQNVDRLHQAAGATDVIELHGTLWIWQCLECRNTTEEIGPAFNSYPPRCPCGGLRRPGVVWFGETLPEDALIAAQRAVAACDYFISVGTSGAVYPAAGLIEQALATGARVLEVNSASTPFSDQVTWFVLGKSGQVIPQIVENAFGA
jgi:NAD-dependent deacetylase